MTSYAIVFMRPNWNCNVVHITAATEAAALAAFHAKFGPYYCRHVVRVEVDA